MTEILIYLFIFAILPMIIGLIIAAIIYYKRPKNKKLAEALKLLK